MSRPHSNAGEVGKALLRWSFVVWSLVAVGVLIISSLYDAYKAQHEIVSLLMLSPGAAVALGVVFQIELIVHWVLCGLFARKGSSRLRVPNMMLALAILLAVLVTSEQAMNDYFDFSPLCGANESNVHAIDVSWQCARAYHFQNWLQGIALLLPLLAIPVRITISRFLRRSNG